jgi:Cdc6-like AAA superfamily ATPase
MNKIDESISFNFFNYTKEELLTLLERQKATDIDREHEIAILEGGRCPFCNLSYKITKLPGTDIIRYIPICSCYEDYKRSRRLDQLLLTCGAPRLYNEIWQKTEYESQKILVDNYIKEKKYKEKKWLIILGTPGTGKTWSAVNVMRAALRDGMLVNFFPMVQLIDHILQNIEIRTQGLIVLDDFDKVTATNDWGRIQVYAFLEKLKKNSTAVITSNITNLDDLKKKFGDVIISRILENSLLVNYIGLDRRIIKIT